MIRLLLVISLLSGCASLTQQGKITEVDKGVVFETARPAKMTMEKNGATYTYDSQAESITSKIISILTLGAISTK